MPSHLSDVGFSFSEDNFLEELIQTFEVLMKDSSREISKGEETYLVLYLDKDIEFWLPIGNNKMIDPTSFEMHFNTHRWVDITNPKWVTKKCCNMQGIISLWSANKSYPMNITVPNAVLVPEVSDEKTFEAQIVCFAEVFDIYESEEDFYKEHNNIGTKAFIPIGQFGSANNDEDSSHAWFSGIVKEINCKKTPCRKIIITMF